MLRRPSAARSPMQEPDNSAEVVRTREALEELVKTAGWQLFVNRAIGEWQGRGYVVKMKTALTSSDPGFNAKVVDRAADEIIRLLQWPSDQINELKGVVEE